MCSRLGSSPGSAASPPRATRSPGGAARPPNGAAAHSRPARRPSVVRIVRGLAADVVGDALLERLQPVEQLLRRHGLLRLPPEKRRRGIYGNLPGAPLHRLGRAVVARLLERLDSVEVDVR